MKLPGPMALGLAAILYGAAALTANPSVASGLDAAERAALEEMRIGEMRKLVLHDAPRERLATPFKDEGGAETTLARFAGKLVVLNFWATWCPPCRAEMPSLDRLAAVVRGEGIEVVTLSTDRGGVPPVKRFFGEIGVKNLAIYNDATNAIAREASLIGLPVTLILDRNGREIGRVTGDAEWDSPETVAMLRALAQATGAGGPQKARFKAIPASDTPRLGR